MAIVKRERVGGVEVLTTDEITRAPAYRFPAGSRVIVTNWGDREVLGTVRVVRLAPPDYTEPLLVTVDLDPDPRQPYTVGLTLPAARVRLA